MRRISAVVVFAVLAGVLSLAQTPAQPQSRAIPKGAKVFLGQMPDGFETYLAAAIEKKKVPVTLVKDRKDAEFEVTGHSETQKASTAKKLIMWDWHSNEQASIQVIDLKSSEVAFAYSVNKVSSAHGKRSTAEACAKHLKEKIESGK